MEESIKIAFRFLLFPRGQEITLEFHPETLFSTVKEEIKAKWTEANLNPEIRLIYSGKSLKDDQKVSEIQSKDGCPVTIHVVNKSPNLQINTQTTQSEDCGAQTSGRSPTEAGDSSEDQEPFLWDSSIHFHGCFFNQEELEQLEVVFNKAANRNSNQRREENNEANQSIFQTNKTVPFADVHKFLQSYWNWMKRTLQKDQREEFPTQELMRIKEEVLPPNQNHVDFTVFLEIFFLFDNTTPSDTCPHGTRERVKIATEKLHSSLASNEICSSTPTTPTPLTAGSYPPLQEPLPNSEEEQMCPQIFNQLFEMIDKDRDQVLSCQELELFFYLYSARVVSEGVVRTPAPPTSC